MFYVYGIINCVNGKLYIGKTCDLHDRWLDHLRTAKGGKEKCPRKFFAIHQAIVKYGESNFEIFCIQRFNSEITAYQAEKYWIEFLQTKNNKLGYNIAPGGIGSGSGKDSPNFGLKRSASTLNKLRESHLGEKNHNYGKDFSQETRLVMRVSQKGNQAGEKHPKSILTWSDVDEIRCLHKKGWSLSQLSEKFNTHKSNISHIVNNRTWIKPAIIS
jgi:group I intron endonuclease